MMTIFTFGLHRKSRKRNKIVSMMASIILFSTTTYRSIQQSQIARKYEIAPLPWAVVEEPGTAEVVFTVLRGTAVSGSSAKTMTSSHCYLHPG